MGCGYIAGFDYWENCPFGLLFYMFFWYGMCMISGAFWLTTFITTVDSANNVSYVFILMVFIVQLAFSQTDANLELFYSDTAKQQWQI